MNLVIGARDEELSINDRRRREEVQHCRASFRGVPIHLAHENCVAVHQFGGSIQVQ
jgi:hypothetical protein